MLDTGVCSFIMREHSALNEQGNRIVISAITYAEMRYGQIGKMDIFLINLTLRSRPIQ